MNSITIILVSKNAVKFAACIDRFKQQRNTKWDSTNFVYVTPFAVKDHDHPWPHKSIKDNEAGINGTFNWPRAINLGLSAFDSEYISWWSDDLIFDNDLISNANAMVSEDLNVIPFCMPGQKSSRGVYYIHNYIVVNYGFIKRNTILNAGKLDEGYTFYAADGDISVRIQQMGGKYKILDKLIIEHDHHFSTHSSDEDNARFISKHKIWPPIFKLLAK
jgi:hypothetical protein